MKRIIVLWLIVIVAAGCGGEVKKPSPLPGGPSADELFDKSKTVPGKKTGPGAS